MNARVLCSLLLLVALSFSAAAQAAPTPAPAPAVSSAALDSDAVARLFLDHAAGDLKVIRVARGWKLSGIAKDSLAAELGLQNGDVVVSIAGKAIRNGVELRAAYEAFRKDGKTQVVLERAGGPLQLNLRLDAPVPVAPPEQDFRPDVRAIDDHSWEMSRARRDAILEDPSLLSRGARIVPSIRNGRPNGFKLYAIRPGSLYDAFGLKNGDTVHKINGWELTDPDRCLEIYQKLRQADTLTIELTRRGEERVHTYRFVE